jgi:hypothetical protein
VSVSGVYRFTRRIRGKRRGSRIICSSLSPNLTPEEADSISVQYLAACCALADFPRCVLANMSCLLPRLVAQASEQSKWYDHDCDRSTVLEEAGPPRSGGGTCDRDRQ